MWEQKSYMCTCDDYNVGLGEVIQGNAALVLWAVLCCCFFCVLFFFYEGGFRKEKSYIRMCGDHNVSMGASILGSAGLFFLFSFFFFF